MEEAIDLTSAFAYLDMLRESGATNMYGAGAYLERDQDLGREDARRVLGLWMKTFDPNQTPAERAAIAEAAK